MPSHSSKTALRSALACDYPELRRAAKRRIRRALAATNTLAAAARELGIPRRSLDKIRTEFPEVFRVSDPPVGAE